MQIQLFEGLLIDLNRSFFSTIQRKFQKKKTARLDAVKTFMRIRRVPEHLKIKVIKWFDYLWMTKKSSDEFQCVSFLPGKNSFLALS